MIFHALRLKDTSLESLIRDQRTIDKESLARYLDCLIDTAEKEFDNAVLSQLFIMFGKWLSYYIDRHGYDYERRIDRSFLERKAPIQAKPITINVLGAITKKVASGTEYGVFDKLAAYVLPYTMMQEESIKKIDPNGYKKFRGILECNRAVRLFKESKLEEARVVYASVKKRLKKERNLNSVEIYSLAWAFHGLGNIELVKCNYGLAYELFEASLKLKRELPQLPEIISYSTQAKLVVASIWNSSVTEWRSKLFEFQTKLEGRREIEESNPVWYKNVQLDIAYQLAKSYRYVDNRSSAQRYCKQAIDIGEQVGDLIGLARCYALDGMLDTSPELANTKLVSLLERLEEHSITNPYLKLIISEPYIQEIELYSLEYARLIRETFRAFNVSPLAA